MPHVELEVNDRKLIGRRIYVAFQKYESRSYVYAIPVLYVINFLTILLLIYTVYVVHINRCKWSVHTVILVQIMLISCLIIPISLIHPYFVLIYDEFAMFSMSSVEENLMIPYLIAGFYNTCYYTFSSMLVLTITQYLTRKSQLGQRFKIALAVMNIPLTFILGVALSSFCEFLQEPKDNGLPPRYVILDVSSHLYVIILCLFCGFFGIFAIFCYNIHQKMDRLLEALNIDNKNEELTYMELQILVGFFYALLPFATLLSGFILKSNANRIIISEILTLCTALQPICYCLVALAGHDGLYAPEFIRRLVKCGKKSKSRIGNSFSWA